MKTKLWIVFWKELRETLRDKRSLSMLALFTLFYPAMIGLMLHQGINKSTKTEREGIELAVIGGAKAPTLMSQLAQKNITAKETAPMDEEAIGELLRSKKVAAVLRLPDDYTDNYMAMRPARVEIWYDSASDRDRQRGDVEEVLRAYGSNIAGARLLAHGVSPAALNPVIVQRYDTGTNASRSAVLIGGIIGILFFPAFMLSMSAAVDSTAGERERRSLEVLMAQPARTWELVCGKWLAASTLGIVGVTLELMLAHLILSWLPLEELGMTWSLGWGDLLLVCLVTVPLALLGGALHIALAMNSKSFKEAQTMISFVLIVPIIPGFVVSFMELKTAQWMYMVPFLSNQTLVTEMSKAGHVGAMPFLLTVLCSAIPAALIIAYASWRMKSERYVLGV
ncbi:ABC transporter permease subunit [Massilia sp. IC2-477]|uniref:ABC transporter permease n=1 Tax=unclassified Massilia TaxID=2609279 RepID=UPI001D1290B5|nr:MULTISPECIES: ABC transporter permease [unclassified Massilia]MCC2958116.1 ABC transporter permease subunit [Massilia sp. IC2-477]MCC2971344.1 ABC transporter permease subunit [Massilia sp. IC2-476]